MAKKSSFETDCTHLQPGDQVVVNSVVYGSENHRTFKAVTRVTRTQVVVDNERFNRATGWQIGTSGYFANKKWLTLR